LEVLELESRRLLSYTVNDGGDAPLDRSKGPAETSSGSITLRSAIQQLDIDGSGVIEFAVSMIKCTTLPTISVPATIDGGAVGDVVISGSGLVFTADKSVAEDLVIDNSGSDGIDMFASDGSILVDHIGTNGAGTSGVSNAGDGVVLTGSNNDVSRCVISANLGDGIAIYGVDASDNRVDGSYIGTDVTGTKALPNADSGVDIYGGASGNTVGGTTAAARNIVSGNKGDAVDISRPGTSANLIEGDFIGTDITGTTALANAGAGVSIYDAASANTIGGTTAAARNIVSGNNGDGVDVAGQGTSANLVQGDFIGTDFTGSTALGNAQAGVSIYDAASANVIGGTNAAARNIISGNNGDGIDVSGQGAAANRVEGNFIGTDITGTKALANADVGVNIYSGASGNIVGGTTAAARNIVSGNYGDGLDISGQGTSANLVEGNFIGTDITGAKPIANLRDGVEIQKTASDNAVGGALAGAGNLIAFNDWNGVQVGANTADNSTGNAILANAIYANGTRGIDLGNEKSPTGAPAGAHASGPNNLQNAPVLTKATSGRSKTTISGTLVASPNTNFRIEFFSDRAGTSQGQKYLGFLDVATNRRGFASFGFSPMLLVAAGGNVTATATDPKGNTSEFSMGRKLGSS